MSAPTTRSHASVPQHTGTDVRPSVVRLLWDQLGYAVRDLWRTRVAFIFTFLFPLTFLVVLGAMVGTETISADSTVRVMQFVSPAAAVMGALYGTYPTVASSLADARERGVLKRVHGTPLPGWVYLAGRIGAAVLFALGSLTLMLSVGVIAYGVQIQWHTMPATVVTVLAAVTCFAALGVAVAGLARSALVAQAVSIATAVVLSWISGVMGYGDMPTWADRIAQIFPLKPFNDALAVQFDPFATGTGWDLAALAVLGAWAIGAVVVASLTFRWDPAAASGHRRPVASGPGPTEAGPSPVSGAGVVVSVAAAGRPSRLALLSAQARWATRSALHDTAWVFFALAMPVAQYLFSAAVIGDGAAGTELTPPFGLQSATGMIAWGAIVTAMVFMPDAIARARTGGSSPACGEPRCRSASTSRAGSSPRSCSCWPPQCRSSWPGCCGSTWRSPGGGARWRWACWSWAPRRWRPVGCCWSRCCPAARRSPRSGSGWRFRWHSSPTCSPSRRCRSR